MANHSELVVLWSASMDVAVTSTHWTLARAEISPRDIQQRFAERGSSSLVANQRRENVAFLQEQSTRCAHRLLALADIDTASDQAASVQTNEFFLQRPRQQHPTKRFQEALMWWRGLFGFRLALRRLKHPPILREIGQRAQKDFAEPTVALRRATSCR